MTIDTELRQKEQRLCDALPRVPSLAVAYSGGVDSAYLAYAAHRVPGDRMLAVTALSGSYSDRDLREVQACVARFNLPHEFVNTDEVSNPACRANNPDRCFFCKDELFSKLDALACDRCFAAGANAGCRGPTQSVILTGRRFASLACSGEQSGLARDPDEQAAFPQKRADFLRFS
ncbi:MAG: hypothetical protein M1404_07975 [Acidobacteria bacterium]|nr:hypothetical protein [Acidobacteriota bacterium]